MNGVIQGQRVLEFRLLQCCRVLWLVCQSEGGSIGVQGHLWLCSDALTYCFQKELWTDFATTLKDFWRGIVLNHSGCLGDQVEQTGSLSRLRGTRSCTVVAKGVEVERGHRSWAEFRVLSSCPVVCRDVRSGPDDTHVNLPEGHLLTS